MLQPRRGQDWVEEDEDDDEEERFEDDLAQNYEAAVATHRTVIDFFLTLVSSTPIPTTSHHSSLLPAP